MKQIVANLREYFISINKPVFFLTSFAVAILITINYTIGIESKIVHSDSLIKKLAGFFFLYAFIFSLAYWLRSVFVKEGFSQQVFFYALLLLAPVIFAFKIGYNGLPSLFTHSMPFPWNQYWDIVLDWPLKCLLIFLLVSLLWRIGKYDKPIAGWGTQGFFYRPYLLLLLCMVPLIALAATQPDFLQVYPKLKKIEFICPYTSSAFIWNFLYEISYGIDFITIETFFRGFLVLAFVRYAGKDAILPMAAFYCTIHFGKPLFECITSYFGGMILGVIVYYTRSIWGGLIVHLGIAWLMEIAGYISNGG